VLVDRFFLSTYAYQGVGRGLPEDALRQANAMATNGLVPDLTLLLTIPVERGMERVGARDRGLDRIETVALEFHERVARAFQTFATQKWQEAHPECGPIALIDATGSEPDVFALVLAELHERWPGTFPPRD
jgi:dTMP kinase